MPMSRWTSLMSRTHLLPAGDVDRLPGHVAGLIGGQEYQHVADILIGAAAPQGDLLNVAAAHFFGSDAPPRRILLVEALLPERRIEQITGADGVHADAVRRQIERDAL